MKTKKNLPKVLLLDASYEDAARFKSLLEKFGAELGEWVPSGARWIAPLQEIKPEIIIVNYTLPKRDGIYCIEKIMEMNSTVKILFVHSFSGLAANDIESLALARGAVSVLQKPFSDSRFFASMQRMLKI
jgi:two-component system chemotaxis response regulator CheY